ncbi:MAG: hypothetical protein OEY97_01975 [Nitrospirota bacterium]|nr:hypothetical protein [Nitrospirota bacterium]
MRKRPILPIVTPETRAPRAPLTDDRIRADVRTVDGVWSLHGWVRTLAPGGMYVESRLPIPPDAEVNINCVVSHRGETLRINLLGWVVYQDTSGVAFQFDESTITDPERIDALVAHYLETAEAAAA